MHEAIKARTSFQESEKSIGTNLILSSAQVMCREILGEETVIKIGSISLSNNTVSRRIEDMASNVKDSSLICDAGPFAMQINESTDVGNLAQLMVYVWFMFQNKPTYDILFCKDLLGKMAAAEIFKLLNDFIISHSLDCQNCISICTWNSGDDRKAKWGHYLSVGSCA